MKTLCPSCNQRFEVADELNDRRIECPVCRNKFSIRTSVPHSLQQPNPIVKTTKTKSKICYSINTLNFLFLCLTVSLIYLSYIFYNGISSLQLDIANDFQPKYNELQSKHAELKAIKIKLIKENQKWKNSNHFSRWILQ